MTQRSSDSSSRLGESHPRAGESARRFLRRCEEVGGNPRPVPAGRLQAHEAPIVRDAARGPRGASPRYSGGSGGGFARVVRKLLGAARRVVEVRGHLEKGPRHVGVAGLVLALVRVDVLLRALAELHDRLVRVAVAALDGHDEDVDHVQLGAVFGCAHGADDTLRAHRNATMKNASLPAPDAPADYTAALSGLGHRFREAGVLAVEGPDREAFLQGQLTQDARGLAPGQSRPMAGLSPKGKLLYFGRLVAQADRLLLVVPRSAVATVAEHLRKYAVFQKVSVTDRSEEFLLLGFFSSAVGGLRASEAAIALPADGEFAAGLLAPAADRGALDGCPRRGRIRRRLGRLRRDPARRGGPAAFRRRTRTTRICPTSSVSRPRSRRRRAATSARKSWPACAPTGA